MGIFHYLQTAESPRYHHHPLVRRTVVMICLGTISVPFGNLRPARVKNYGYAQPLARLATVAKVGKPHPPFFFLLCMLLLFPPEGITHCFVNVFLSGFFSRFFRDLPDEISRIVPFPAPSPFTAMKCFVRFNTSVFLGARCFFLPSHQCCGTFSIATLIIRIFLVFC